MTDLGTLASMGVQTSEAWGLNDVGQVVGVSSTNVSGASHAFLWGNASGLQDLGTLGGNSVARAVNNAGFVVGGSNLTTVPIVTRAFLWQPGTGMTDLGSLGGSDDSSEAWDIHDEMTLTPIQVVGWTETGDNCEFAGHEGEEIVGFVWKDVAGMRPLGPIGEHGGVPNLTARAFGLSVAAGLGPVTPEITTIAGTAIHCGTTPVFCATTSADSVAWEVLGLDVDRFDLVEPTAFGDGAGEARDVNIEDNLVGWGLDESSECHERALLWESPGDSSPVNLHTDLQGEELPAGDGSRAEALSDPDQSGTVTVVGHRVPEGALNEALRWQGQGTSWTVEALDSQINAGSCGWSLREARDVNEDGWIVGLGSHNGSLRAFLLTPLGSCPADTDDNGAVDVLDLLAILGHFGACPVSVICRWDVNADCTVDSLDILELLAAYGQCPAGSQGLQGGDGSSTLALEAAVQYMGFADVAAYQAWLSKANEEEAVASATLLAAMLAGD